MLSSYHEGDFSVGKNGCRALRYLIKGFIGTAYAEFYVTAVKDAYILKVAVQPGAVGLQAE
jgi:hypothetical protein